MPPLIRPSSLDEAGDAVRQVIRAYHGSPYDFDRFDASKIGTGEGAQAYGHGLYFAGNEGVARQYREMLAGRPVGWTFELGGGDVWPQLRQLPDDVQRGLLELHGRLGIYKDPSDPALLSEARKHITQGLRNFDSGSIPMDDHAYRSYVDALKVLDDPNFRVRPGHTPGHMYEVEIAYPEGDLLDLDAPAKGRHKAALMRAAFAAPENKWQKMAIEEITSRGTPSKIATESLLRAHNVQNENKMLGRAQAQAAVSEALMREGIPGARYFDQFSRTAGEGTRNYVIFPGAEDQIRILRKYGMLAPIPAAAAMGVEE